MTEQQIAKAFADFIKGKGLLTQGLSLSLFPRLLLDYYREIRFAELSEQDDSDLLLFQYGIYDWGEGRFFEIDFTRQFYEVFPETGDHCIYQHRFTFYFEPVNFTELASFNVWSNTCDDLEAFQRVVTRSPGYLASLQYAPMRFEATIQDVC